MSIGTDEGWPHRQLFIAHRLRQRRSDIGLTQQQVVARLAAHGLQTTNRALSSLEHGAGLDVAKLPPLAAALECTVTYLVGLTDDPNRWTPDGVADEGPGPQAARPAAPAHSGSGPSLILGADVPDRGPQLTLKGRLAGP
jgi:transcriptional regulator with XRE-family HTH domain